MKIGSKKKKVFENFWTLELSSQDGYAVVSFQYYL